MPEDGKPDIINNPRARQREIDNQARELVKWVNGERSHRESVIVWSDAVALDNDEIRSRATALQALIRYDFWRGGDGG